MNFREKYLKAVGEKESQLCVGLDPALNGQRESQTILVDEADPQALTDYCVDFIREVSDYAAAVKPNTQYLLFHLGLKELKAINKTVHDGGMVSILDHKLSDIGSSNESAVHWIAKAGFDAVTYSPYPGNISETIKQAGKEGLGVFTLCLMSNPQAAWMQKESRYGENQVYLKVAELAASTGGEGLVVAATGEAGLDEIEALRKITGEEVIYLYPGVGAQGGSLKKIRADQGNKLVNVGRAIMYHEDPGKKAGEYKEKINCRS